MPAINISALESAKIFERFASDDNLWWALVRAATAAAAAVCRRRIAARADASPGGWARATLARRRSPRR